MIEQQPKPGEWWWVELWDELPGEHVPAKLSEGGAQLWRHGDLWYERVTPIRRLADQPPAPKPSEREKVDARRTERLLKLRPRIAWADVARVIREDDEAAGYVLAPTSGPGFEAMAESLQRAFSGLLTIGSAKHLLRAALESLKGEGR